MSGGQQKEVVFDLDAAAFSSDDFRMYQFKVAVTAPAHCLSSLPALYKPLQSLLCLFTRR